MSEYLFSQCKWRLGLGPPSQYIRVPHPRNLILILRVNVRVEAAYLQRELFQKESLPCDLREGTIAQE